MPAMAESLDLTFASGGLSSGAASLASVPDSLAGRVIRELRSSTLEAHKRPQPNTPATVPLQHAQAQTHQPGLGSCTPATQDTQAQTEQALPAPVHSAVAQTDSPAHSRPAPSPRPTPMVVVLGAEGTTTTGSVALQLGADLPGDQARAASEPVSEGLVRAVLEEMRAPASHHLPPASPSPTTAGTHAEPSGAGRQREHLLLVSEQQARTAPTAPPPSQPPSSSSEGGSSIGAELSAAHQQAQALSSSSGASSASGLGSRPSPSLLIEVLGHFAAACEGPEVPEDLVARVLQELLNLPAEAAASSPLASDTVRLLPCALHATQPCAA